MSWNRYIEENYSHLMEVAEGLTDYPNDLIHFTFLRCYDKTPDDKDRYFKRAMKLNSISTTFRKQFNQVWEEVENIPIEHDLDKRICLERVDTVLRHLDKFDRTIFELYLQGEEMKQLSKESGIPISTIYLTLSKARQAIKDHA